MTSCDGNPGPGFGHAGVSGEVIFHLIKMDFRPPYRYKPILFFNA
jgi:hypothetical protein